MDRFVGRKRSAKRAKEIFDALTQIAGNKDLDGINYDRVWRAAQNPKHILHKEFNWDKDKALRWSLHEQARKLVADVRYQIITIDGFEANVRAAVSIVRADPNNKKRTYHGLISRKTLLKFSKSQERAQFVESAKEQLRQWVLNYGDVKELSEIRKVLIRLLGMKVLPVRVAA